MGSTVVKPADWTVTGVSGADTAQTLTKAAASGASRHFVTHISVSFGAATETATGVLVQLEMNDVVKMSWYATNDLVVDFTHPLEGSAGDTVQLVIGQGGTSVVSIGNLAGFTL